MNLIDRRLDRQRRAIREEIMTLEQRLETRIPSRERKTLIEEVERLEELLSNLDMDKINERDFCNDRDSQVKFRLLGCFTCQLCKFEQT